MITPFEVERVQGHDGLQPHAFRAVRLGRPGQAGDSDGGGSAAGLRCAPSRSSASRARSCRPRSRSSSPTGFGPRDRSCTPTARPLCSAAAPRTRPSSSGIRRAQRGAEARYGCGARALSPRREKNGSLVLDGEPFTCERVKIAIQQAFTSLNLLCDEFIVFATGPQTAVGHEMGSGEIRPDEPIVPRPLAARIGRLPATRT